MKIRCGTCQGETNHDVLKEYKETFNNDAVSGESIWQIIRCKRCSMVSFRNDSYCSEDYEHQEKLYPERGEHILPIKSFNRSYRKTRIVRRIYREVINSFNNQSYTLCAAGIRAVIEGICKIEKIKEGPVKEKQRDGTYIDKRKRNLEGKIAGLAENDVITKKYSDYLHDLRFMGNEAVHDLEEPSPEELKHAIRIIENLIENIYEISKTAAEFKELRQDKAVMKRAK